MVFKKKQVKLSIAFLSLLLIGCFIYGVFYLREQTPLKKGIRFLLTTEQEFVGGVPLLMGGLNRICRDEKLVEFAKNKVEQQGNEVEKLIYYKTSNPSYYPQDIFVINNLASPYNRIAAKSAFCEIFAYQDIEKEINRFEKDGGYNSAHTLSALTLIKEKGCYSEGLINPLIEDLANELTIAQDEEGTSDCANIDIYAERAAFIGYAGYPIKDSWIISILNCQLPDGSWDENTHSTVLALWALAQQKGNCK